MVLTTTHITFPTVLLGLLKLNVLVPKDVIGRHTEIALHFFAH